MTRGFARDPWQEMSHSRIESRKLLAAEFGIFPINCKRFFHNTHYYVMCFEQKSDWGTIDHLMIADRKGRKSDDHWQFLQRVKNEIMGEERLAVEVYPPVTQLINQVNAYHLWVLPEGFKLPFGLNPGWAS